MYLDVEYSPVIFCSDINAYTLNKERHKANTVVQGERLRHISRHPWSFSILQRQRKRDQDSTYYTVYNMHGHKYTHTHAHVYRQTHTHTHTHTHTYTHILNEFSSSLINPNPSLPTNYRLAI